MIKFSRLFLKLFIISFIIFWFHFWIYRIIFKFDSLLWHVELLLLIFEIKRFLSSAFGIACHILHFCNLLLHVCFFIRFHTRSQIKFDLPRSILDCHNIWLLTRSHNIFKPFKFCSQISLNSGIIKRSLSYSLRIQHLIDIAMVHQFAL